MLRAAELLFLWVFSIYYSFIVVFRILRECFSVGFRQVLESKPIERPSCLDDPDLGTHGYLSLEGIRIHYVASGPVDKPLMLLVHGFPEFWFSWRYQIKEFQKDYRVVAIDQRGYGESEKPKGIDEYTLKKLTSDIKQIISALGYEKCVLVGHDWGGAVAWSFGRLVPEMVDKLIVLNCPSNPVFQKIIQTNIEQMKMSWYMFFFQMPFLPELYIRMKNYEMLANCFTNKNKNELSFSSSFQNPMSEEELQAYKYNFSAPGAITPPVNFYRAAFQKKSGSVPYDMNYTIPVLLIWGCKDMALNIALPDTIEKENYPNVTVKRIPEAGHFTPIDTPFEVNKLIRGWLSSF